MSTAGSPDQRDAYALKGSGIRTKLGRALLPLNSRAGQVDAAWGSTGFMVFTMIALLLFLLILLLLYNSTLILDDFALTWTDSTVTTLGKN
uniref:Photosystem II 10 kDa phosphoprotein n=2 Tax=Karenia mikimotoi TaxID=225107 RepID=A0A0U1WP58_KARMI|nr:photosystem II 10 kDa phosphoprotein [Karenia mikimotoi]